MKNVKTPRAEQRTPKGVRVQTVESEITGARMKSLHLELPCLEFAIGWVLAWHYGIPQYICAFNGKVMEGGRALELHVWRLSVAVRFHSNVKRTKLRAEEPMTDSQNSERKQTALNELVGPQLGAAHGSVSATPRTDAIARDGWDNNPMSDLCRQLEMEMTEVRTGRDASIKMAWELVQELVRRCHEPIHKRQLEEIRKLHEEWTLSPNAKITQLPPGGGTTEGK